MILMKIKTIDDYDYYCDKDACLFNIVKSGSPSPIGGYKNAAYILAIKGIARFNNAQDARNYFIKD